MKNNSKECTQHSQATTADLLTDELTNALSTISMAISEAENLALTKTFKIVHLINRLKRQFFKGSLQDKKDFVRWLKTHSESTDVHHTYNQIFNVIHILETAKKSALSNKAYTGSYMFKLAYTCSKKYFDNATNSPLSAAAKKMRKIIAKRTYKGIVVYPHTIFWDNMQTPQHLLIELSKKGYLCIFCEHNSLPRPPKEVHPNLFVLRESDAIQSIYDKDVIVFCTWMCSMGWVEQLQHKTLWYHILDKIDIFANYDEDYLAKHNEVIKRADVITYVAHELKRYLPKDIAGHYLPNGTNVSDFINIHPNFIPPDMKEIVNSNKKIVGYYGLISYWFNMEMMTELADRNPDINFVFIGDYVESAPLPQRANMFFLGKKPYKTLSDYAKFFDCAIIPFEISDMMDCVSPIKFFEYRALGLPVVSSYMKEMEQYEAPDVIIANDTLSFEKAIYKTFEPEIKNLSKETGKAFALNQQWSTRGKHLEKLLDSVAKASGKQ